MSVEKDGDLLLYKEVSMNWLLFIGSILTAAAGSFVAAIGLCLSVDKGKKSSLLVGFLTILGRQALPVIVLASSFSVLRQSNLLLLFLLGAGVYGVMAASGLLGLISPYSCYRSVWRRECAVIFYVLIYLIMVGARTLTKTHPDVTLGWISGVLLLLLFAAECVGPLAESMRGYPLEKHKTSWPAVPALLLAGTGLCIAVIGGFLTGEQAGILVDSGKKYPAFWGLLLGILMAVLFFAVPVLKEWRKGSSHVQPGLYGPASLAFCGGLGCACLFGPVTLTYPAVLSAIVAAVLMLVQIVIGMRQRRVRRAYALGLLTAAVLAMAVLIPLLSDGFY